MHCKPMSAEGFREITTGAPYPEVLERALDVSNIIDLLERQLDRFLDVRLISLKSELATLRAIKLFVHQEEKQIRAVTSKSIVSGFDCLTLSVIACLLAHRKGYDTKIGRPDVVTRYFHSLVLKSDGVLFKVAGRNRSYPVKELSPHDVVRRLHTVGLVIRIADSLRGHLGLRAS